jgi:uncharacterized protein (TIGR00369 family)
MGSGMPSFEPQDREYEARVRQSFARQRALATLGATLARVVPGEVEIHLPFRPELSQQHGFLHAGVSTAVVDTACGYAALTLMPAGTAVLTIEFKVNLLAPGQGELFVATGRVVKPGRTVTVCSGEVEAVRGGERRAVALMQATMMSVQGRPGLSD